MGAHVQIQKRIYSVRKFLKAKRIAMEVETERGKPENKGETVNTTTTVSTTDPVNGVKNDSIQKQLLDLCATVQAQHQTLLNRPNTNCSAKINR